MKETRITIDEILIENAYSWAKRSSCKRLQVGSVISRNGRIISTGYNGSPTGMDNCCEKEEYDGFGVKQVTLPHIVHSEANAILFAAKEGVKLEGCSIHITHAPCVECAKMIIQSGIKSVIYAEYYRDSTGLKLLQEAGLYVKCWNSI